MFRVEHQPHLRHDFRIARDHIFASGRELLCVMGGSRHEEIVLERRWTKLPEVFSQSKHRGDSTCIVIRALKKSVGVGTDDDVLVTRAAHLSENIFSVEPVICFENEFGTGECALDDAPSGPETVNTGIIAVR